MKKESFQYLYSFRYHNRDYIYLFSKNYPFYFLEYHSTSNQFEYPEINTFRELFRLFYSNETTLLFHTQNEFKKIKEKLSYMNIDLTPLVRTTSGFLSLALVLSLCGCRQTERTSPIDHVEPSAIVETLDKSQEISRYFKNYNMDVIDKEYDGNDYIFVKEFINSHDKHQITIGSFEEFRQLNQIDFIPSWNDVIHAFQENENIDDEKKNIILDCIENMKNSEELKGIDLSVLYVNAKRMKFQYLSTEEMTQTVNRDSVYAYFDSLSGTVYLPNDKPLEKFEFIHEVLGHGTLAYREENDNSLMVFDCTNYLMLPTEERYTGYSVGIMISEGGANMIAHIATNDYSVSTFYELYEEELRVIADLCHVSIGELFNHKGIDFYDLMYQNGINTPVEYIFKMDGILKGKLYCEFSDLMERLFLDATEEKILNSNQDQQDEIIQSTIEIIRNSNFKDKNELRFEYDGGAIQYNFEESASRFEESISHLRGSK